MSLNALSDNLTKKIAEGDYNTPEELFKLLEQSSLVYQRLDKEEGKSGNIHTHLLREDLFKNLQGRPQKGGKTLKQEEIGEAA